MLKFVFTTESSLLKLNLSPVLVLFEKTTGKVEIEVMRLSPSLDFGL